MSAGKSGVASGKANKRGLSSIGGDAGSRRPGAGKIKAAAGGGGGRRGLIVNLGLLLAAVIVSVLFLEVVLRLVGFSYVLYPEAVEFGYPGPTHIRDIFQEDGDLYWVSMEYYVLLDQYIRDRVDLVFMGDSATQFGGHPKILEDLFNEAYPDTEIMVRNMGVAGWTSFQGKRQMARDISRLKPNVAVIQFGWNDHWYGFGVDDEGLSEIKKYYNDVPKWLRDLRVSQMFLRFFISSYSDGSRPNRVSPEDYRENLVEMVEQARSSRITPVLSTAPTSMSRGNVPQYLAERWARSLDEVVPLHGQYNDIVREVAREKEVPLCDMAALFEQTRNPSEYFMADGIHLNKEGDRVYAEGLFKCFEDNKVSYILVRGAPFYREKPGLTEAPDANDVLKP